MGGRIITLQRQVRELGRLRAGLMVASNNGRQRPTSSRNWILTSGNRGYIEAAAELWGGQVASWQPQGKGASEWRVITEAPVIDAVLPPGDPISQAYEMWTGGGCARRCDGVTEQRSGAQARPCVCRATFGEEFHLVPQLDADNKPQRCSMTTRLSVLLPGLPDIGVWRVESKGYWPGVHITGYVEIIKSQVGEQAMVPVTLGIEPRHRIKDGRTSQFIEIVVALKGRTSFGEIVANPKALAIGGPADDRTIEAPQQRAALPAAPAPATPPAAPATPPPGSPDWPQLIANATTQEELQEVGNQIAADPVAVQSKGLHTLWVQRQRQIANGIGKAAGKAPAEQTPPPPAAPSPVDTSGEEPDPDEMWAAIMRLGGDRGWDTSQCSQAVRDAIGVGPSEATGWQLRQVRDQLKAQPVGAPA